MDAGLASLTVSSQRSGVSYGPLNIVLGECTRCGRPTEQGNIWSVCPSCTAGGSRPGAAPSPVSVLHLSLLPSSIPGLDTVRQATAFSRSNIDDPHPEYALTRSTLDRRYKNSTSTQPPPAPPVASRSGSRPTTNPPTSFVRPAKHDMPLRSAIQDRWTAPGCRERIHTLW